MVTDDVAGVVEGDLIGGEDVRRRRNATQFDGGNGEPPAFVRLSNPETLSAL